MSKLRTLMVMMLCVVLVSPAFAGAKKKADKDTQVFRYELECAGTGTQGTYLLKVWSYSKKSAIANEQCKKNAVHGVIFKGFSGGNKGCVSQKPLAKNPGVEMDYAEYFKLFFQDGGEYMKYVSLTGGAPEIIKVGKEYKVGQIVTVQKDALRKALEEAGVIKSLSSGF